MLLWIVYMINDILLWYLYDSIYDKQYNVMDSLYDSL
jgi:hypothetical protein